MKSPAFRRPAAGTRGLTLLELLIVITILAVLTTIATRSLTTVGDQAKFDGNEAVVKEFRRALLGNPSAVQSDYTPMVSGFIADFGRPPRVVLNTNLYAAEGEGHSDPNPSGYNLPEMLTIGSLSGIPYGLYLLDINNLVWTNSSTLGAGFPQPIDTSTQCRLGLGWRGPYMQGFSVNYLRDSWNKPITAYSTVNFRYLVDWWVPNYSASAFSGAANMIVPNVDGTGFVSVGNPVSGDGTAVTGLVIRGGPGNSSPDTTDTYAGSFSAGIVYPNEYVSQLTLSVTIGGAITNLLRTLNSGVDTYATSNYVFQAYAYLYNPNPFYLDPRLTASYSGSRSYNRPIGVASANSIASAFNYTNVFSPSTPQTVNFTTFTSQNAGAAGGEPLSPITYPLVHGPKALKVSVVATRVSGPGTLYARTNVTTPARNIVLRPGSNNLQISIP